MEIFDKFIIDNIINLKQPTIYFWLKKNGFSENYIKNLRNTPNAIKLNSQTTFTNSKIKQNDILEISKSPNKASSIPICDGTIDVIYEDEDYLIVNKPHNLSCIPTRSHITNNLGGQIVKYMREKDPNFVLRIINRLDRETAGIVIVAKNVSAFNNTKSDKVYYALCENNFSEKELTINSKILTVSNNGINQMKRIISPLGKVAITHIKLEENYNNYSLISLSLETGRTHQIRVHLSSINHSLIGDTIYSNNSKKFTSNDHALLILKEISFEHFRTKEKIKLSIPFPQEWEKWL